MLSGTGPIMRKKATCQTSSRRFTLDGPGISPFSPEAGAKGQSDQAASSGLRPPSPRRGGEGTARSRLAASVAPAHPACGTTSTTQRADGAKTAPPRRGRRDLRLSSRLKKTKSGMSDCGERLLSTAVHESEVRGIRSGSPPIRGTEIPLPENIRCRRRLLRHSPTAGLHR